MNWKITTSLWASQDSFPWILKGNAKFLPWTCQDFMGRFSFLFFYLLALVNVLLPINAETKTSNQIFKDPKVLLIGFHQFIPNYSKYCDSWLALSELPSWGCILEQGALWKRGNAVKQIQFDSWEQADILKLTELSENVQCA